MLKEIEEEKTFKRIYTYYLYTTKKQGFYTPDTTSFRQFVNYIEVE